MTIIEPVSEREQAAPQVGREERMHPIPGRPVAEPTPAEVPESVRAAVHSEIANKLAFTVGFG